jgi:hypothetical protein
MKALLRSPLHNLVKHLMLLTFAGCKTGKTYTVVVGRHEVNGDLLVPTGTTGRRWRLNFRGGAPVFVTLEGRRREGRGELIEDPEEVIRLNELLLDRVGLQNARRLGLKVNEYRRPTSGELRTVLSGRGLIRIEPDEVP